MRMERQLTKGHRLLIVEDDQELATWLEDELTPLYTEVHTAGSLRCARQLVALKFSVVLLDMNLPDGSGITLARELLNGHPVPSIVALTGQSTREECFEIGRIGAIRFVEKPFTLPVLIKAIEESVAEDPALAVHAARSVGRLSLEEAKRAVRWTMAREALAQSAGNRSQAAVELSVSRQAVNSIMNEWEDS